MESVAFSCTKTPLLHLPPLRKPNGFGSRLSVPDPRRTQIRLVAMVHDKPIAPPPPEQEKEKKRQVENSIEELECLEEEAIAGKDAGREPLDYNRRAHIFYESSRVFQASKDRRGGGGDVYDDRGA